MTEALALLFLFLAACFFVAGVFTGLTTVTLWDWYREAWELPLLLWRMTALAGAIGAGLRYLSLL